MGDGNFPTSKMEGWIINMEEKERRMEPVTTKKEEEEEVSERNRRERLSKFYESTVFTGPEKVSMWDWGRNSEEQEMKEASLLHFINRSGTRIPLRTYLHVLNEMFDELKVAWEELGYPWKRTRGFVRKEFDDPDDFVQMMLLNGAFLLEFMRTKREYSRRSLQHHSPDASVNPIMWRILEDHNEAKSYQLDFLLIGNQLPLVVIDTLTRVGYPQDTNNMDHRIGFLEVFADTFTPMYRPPWNERSDFKSWLHILDLYRSCLVHRDFKRTKTKKIKSQEEFHSMKMNNIPSATALHSVGIRFTISGSKSMLDVSLQGKTLMLPEIVIDRSTRPLFFSLITFEKLHKNVAENEVASYLHFMRCLVLVADDASLLQSCGIIVTTLPPAEVADLFNKMIKGNSLDPDDPLAPEIIEAFTTVRERYNKMAAEWRKDLFQTYLKSPWAILSVVAAILLFTLSFIQTVYTVLGYVHPK